MVNKGQGMTNGLMASRMTYYQVVREKPPNPQTSTKYNANDQAKVGGSRERLQEEILPKTISL